MKFDHRSLLHRTTDLLAATALAGSLEMQGCLPARDLCRADRWEKEHSPIPVAEVIKHSQQWMGFEFHLQVDMSKAEVQDLGHGPVYVFSSPEKSSGGQPQRLVIAPDKYNQLPRAEILRGFLVEEGKDSHRFMVSQVTSWHMAKNASDSGN